MGFTIQDGKGRGHSAGVSKGNRQLVASDSASRAHFASLDGNCFNLISLDATAAAGTYPVYLQNDSATKAVVVDFARVGGVASIFWKFTVVTGTAAGGSALTPVNLNLDSGTAATVTARGNDSITGLTAGNVFAVVRSAANASADVNFDDTVILRQNDAIAVEADAVTSTDVAEILIRFYQVDLSLEV